MITYYIDWYGPFTYDDIVEKKHLETEDFLEGNGLYLLTGKKRWQRSEACIQYVGLTSGSFKNRLTRGQHAGIEKTNTDLQIWLGHICYGCTVDKSVLELAESILIYFVEPPLNQKKTKKPVNKNCTVISRFFKKNGERRVRQSYMLHDIPDVLSWDSDANILYYAHKLEQK